MYLFIYLFFANAFGADNATEIAQILANFVMEKQILLFSKCHQPISLK